MCFCTFEIALFSNFRALCYVECRRSSLFTFFVYLFFRSDKFVRVTSETASKNPNQTMQEVTSVKCPKAQKEYFTVIKNVKQVHSEKYINHHNNNNQLFVFTYFVYTFCLHRLIKFKILESSKNLMTMLSTSWKDYKRK